MLEMRPGCEHCDTDLPPDSTEARICSYECTFCARCVEAVLRNVCPNCGGGFCARPPRVSRAWRDGVSVQHQPAGTTRKHRPVDAEQHGAFAAKVREFEPSQR